MTYLSIGIALYLFIWGYVGAKYVYLDAKKDSPNSENEWVVIPCMTSAGFLLGVFCGVLAPIVGIVFLILYWFGIVLKSVIDVFV
jgi:hypothetical protein